MATRYTDKGNTFIWFESHVCCSPPNCSHRITGLILRKIGHLSKAGQTDVKKNLNQLSSFMLTGIVNYIIEAQQKSFIASAFGQYLSPKVIDELVRDPSKLKLGGEERIMTAYFSDLAGFSDISEKLLPQELVSLLNYYLSEMCEIIGKYEGTVDKFEGDSIVAFWGAPISTEEHALLACKASLEMKRKMVEINVSGVINKLKKRPGITNSRTKRFHMAVGSLRP